MQAPGKAELLHALHIMSQYVSLWMYLSFLSLKLLSLHRTSQGALQGGVTSSHSYSSNSYSHGQSGDKTGKKHLPKRILIYPVPMAFIFCVSSLFLLILSPVLWLPHLQLQQRLNHSQSNLLISRCLSFSYRNRLSSFPTLSLTQMDN